MRRLIPGIVTNACLIVARSGRTVPPTVPTFGPALASDLGDFIGVLAFLHVHQLALTRADEAALLRPHPTRPFCLDLRAESQEAVDQRFRPHGTAGDEDVRRDERVGPLDDRVGVVVRTAADRALAHRDDPFRFRHLLVKPADRGPELERNRAVQEEHVALPRRRAVDDPEPLDIVARIGGRGHLDRAAHDAEVQRPRGVPFRPVEEFADEARLEPFEDGAARSAFHRGVDVLLDPLDEILRTEADDVRLFRALDHLFRTPELWPETRSRMARISGSLLTLPSQGCIPDSLRATVRARSSMERTPPVGLKLRHASHRDARFESAPGGPPRVRRKHDAGIQETARIERLLDPSHHTVDFGAPDPGQRLRADPSDSVFTGRSALKPVEQRAIELFSPGPHPLEVWWIRRIAERAIVRVPVSDVAVDPRDGPVTPREVDQEFHEFRHPVARDDRVFHEAPRFARTRTLNDRRENGSANSPERRLTNRIERDLGGPTQRIG